MEYNVLLFRLSTLYSFLTYALLAERLKCISRVIGFPFFFNSFVRIVTYLNVRTERRTVDDISVYVTPF